MRTRNIPLPFTATALFSVLIAGGCVSAAPDAGGSPAPAAAKAVAAPKSAAESLAAEDGSRYQRVVKEGDTFYCAQDEFVGSRMKKEVCLTETEYEAMREANRRFMHGLQSAPIPAYDPTKQNPSTP